MKSDTKISVKIYRIFLLKFQVVIFLFVILPLSLFRSVTSLSRISSITVFFYGVFVLRMLIECIPRIFDCNWSTDIRWWRQEGLLNRLFVCVFIHY